MINFTELIILGLATYRLASLLVIEEGPFDIFGKFRYFIGIRYDEHNNPYGKNVIASGLMCMWCTTVWMGIFMTILYTILREVVIFMSLPFALSAFAIIIEELFGSHRS